MSAIDDVRRCSSDIVRSTIYIVAGRSISVHASVEVTIYFITRALPPRILSLLERRKTSHSHSHSHSHLHSHSHKRTTWLWESAARFLFKCNREKWQAMGANTAPGQITAWTVELKSKQKKQQQLRSHSPLARNLQQL